MNEINSEKYKEKPKDNRTRNFATVVYPESAPEDWLSILERHCIPAFVSPLHDKDVNPTGEPKKAHYHVVVMFEGKKSLEQVTEIFDTFAGVGVEVVKSLRGYARYLCHLDNPDKHQYNVDEVKSIAADYIGTIGLSIDRYVALGEMQDFCEEYNVLSFYALSKYSRLNRPDWYRVLCDSGAIYMREYLQSKKWSIDNNYNQIIDPATGEIIA